MNDYITEKFNDIDIDKYKKLDFLKEYIEKFNCYIGGGCFKELLDNKEPKDIDLFFRNCKDFDEALDVAKKDSRFRLLSKNDSAVTYFDNNTDKIVQFILKRFFETADKMLDDFDFTITKFTIYKEDSELKILRDKDFFKDLKEKKLSIKDEVNTPISTYLRVFKYLGYGFEIERTLINKIGLALIELDIDNDNVMELYYED